VNIIQDIMATAKVSQEYATELREVIMNEDLLDWSECTTSQFKFAIKQAQMFLENGKSWDCTL
jgi:hypothetical protein